MPRRLTQEEFIARAKEKHGDKYDYSKVEYKNITTKISIICKEHGEFRQIPADHLAGKGCVPCSYSRSSKKNTKGKKVFLERAAKAHGDKYDYSLVPEDVKTKDKVDIVCPTHGTFTQEAKSHTYGIGCPKCGSEQGGLVIRNSLSDFISKSNKVHNNFYDYSKVDYQGVEKEVLISCPNHGDFYQTPHMHLSGRGCRSCGYERNSKNFSLPAEEFLSRVNEIHGNKYEYILENYTNLSSDITVVCNLHGPFTQKASNHLAGYNCPKCSLGTFYHRYKQTTPAILYYVKLIKDGRTYYKIGVTSKSVEERFRCENSVTIVKLKEWPYSLGYIAYVRENFLLRKYKRYKVKDIRVLNGGGNSELFSQDVMGLDNG